MKYLLYICLITCSLFACGDSCEDIPTACSDVVPADEECTAFFNRWFFDAKSNTCTEVGYSGCEQYGFETEEECLSCKCD